MAEKSPIVDAEVRRKGRERKIQRKEMGGRRRKRRRGKEKAMWCPHNKEKRGRETSDCDLGL